MTRNRAACRGMACTPQQRVVSANQWISIISVATAVMAATREFGRADQREDGRGCGPTLAAAPNPGASRSCQTGPILSCPRPAARQRPMHRTLLPGNADPATKIRCRVRGCWLVRRNSYDVGSYSHVIIGVHRPWFSADSSCSPDCSTISFRHRRRIRSDERRTKQSKGGGCLSCPPMVST